MEGKVVQFCQWSLYMAHAGEGMVVMDFGDHFDMEVLLEIKTIH
jgi:hypothetical protein